jgi:cytochrome c oxidase assembly protein subunit 15
MLLLADAIVLVHRAGRPDDAVLRPVGDDAERRSALVQFVLACVVVVTGAVVTNAGPHAGDRKAQRFDVALTEVARVHSISAIVLLVSVLVIVFWIGRRGLSPSRRRPLTLLLLVILAQMAVGYTQYFTGVPPLLVGVHVLGAVLVFTASLQYLLGNRTPEIP